MCKCSRVQGESWESESDCTDCCPPLASEDSDLDQTGDFESFSGTEDEEEESRLSLSSK